MVAGGAIVEHISRHQERIDLFALDERRQPVQKRFILIVLLVVIERVAQVPVGDGEKLRFFLQFYPVR